MKSNLWHILAPETIICIFLLSTLSFSLVNANEDSLVIEDIIHESSKAGEAQTDEVGPPNLEKQKKESAYTALYAQILDKNRQILILRERLKFYEPVSYIFETPSSSLSFSSSLHEMTRKLLNQHMAFNAEINYWTLACLGLILCWLFKASISRAKPVESSSGEMKISTPAYSGDRTPENEHEASLDFAKVLVELGEIDRARKILESVKADGTSVQVAEADSIIHNLPKAKG